MATQKRPAAPRSAAPSSTAQRQKSIDVSIVSNKEIMFLVLAMIVLAGAATSVALFG